LSSIKIQMIIIASEILQGKLQDKNLTHLARSLLENYQFTLSYARVVPDEKHIIKQALEEASKDSDLILLSGGLGPTKDDLTRECLSEWTKRPLTYSPLAHQYTNNQYQSEVPKDHLYNFIPEDFTPLPNPVGRACGLKYKTPENIFLMALPGVPAEFNAIIKNELPALLHEQGAITHSVKQFTFIAKTKYIPEGRLFTHVAPGLWEELEAFGSVSSLPHLLGVDIGVLIKEETDALLEKKIHSVKKTIEKFSSLEKNIWHFGKESLQEVIVQEAKKKKIQFAFLESATGGLMGKMITEIPGSSECFLGSLVTYSWALKENVLGVPHETLQRFGSVSPEVTMAMVEGARKKNLFPPNTLILSMTGVCGPGNLVEGPHTIPEGTFFVAHESDKVLPIQDLFPKKKNLSQTHSTFERMRNQEKFATYCLFELLSLMRQY
jgi:nicotinamide-nucleotide amidase